jgi:hypothetical protein
VRATKDVKRVARDSDDFENTVVLWRQYADQANGIEGQVKRAQDAL